MTRAASGLRPADKSDASSAGPSEAKVYVILGSHACRAGTLMLEYKRVPFRTVRVPTGLHPFATRLLGFPGRTVPALRIDGHRIQSNRAIARFLDEVHPRPPLFPADPDRRRAVEDAERWGDEVFQMAARRTVLAAALHGRDALIDRGDHGRLGPLLWRNSLARLVGARLVGRFVFGVSERTEPQLLADLPGMLDRIDAWVEAGVLNCDSLNAADFTIAPSVALLSYRRDLRAGVQSRPAWALADRILPERDAEPALG
jgi:glutathione S-transferase